MRYHKEDMIGEFYQWNGENMKTIFNDTPSRKAFDRFNGNQVLYIINYYASLDETFSKEYGQMLERMICDELPLEAKSELSVFNWISAASQQKNQKPNY